MTQKLLLCAVLLLSSLFTACDLMLEPVGPSVYSGSDQGALIIRLENVTRGDIVISSNEVIYASLRLTDPNGGVQTAEWAPGGPTVFAFYSALTGDHVLDFWDLDTRGFTNTASAVIPMQAGYNYYVTVLLGGSIIISLSNVYTGGPTPGSAWLAGVQDQFDSRYPVYGDASSAGNHFNFRGFMGTAQGRMKEDDTGNPHSGLNCIRAEVDRDAYGYWSGCYFLNGVLSGTERKPSANWGTVANAGINLSGATRLTFWARGETGSEVVEFYCLGVGRSSNTGEPITPYPDSARKTGTGWVTLTTAWKEYTIDLTGLDLSYVLGGFGWSVQSRPGGIVFYLDDISYDKTSSGTPSFPVSFQTINSGNSLDVILRNTGFVYDACLALMTFLAGGENARAKRIADAIVYAQDHDRYYSDGRLRNAYQGGDLALPPGWIPNGKTNTVRMPGFWDSFHENWFEDEYCVSTYTGNVAWAMLALLAYYETCGGQAYLDAVKKMGDWVANTVIDCRGEGGYFGGVRGWEPDQTNLMWKSTEHNLDLYVAFLRLYAITGQMKWCVFSGHASNFVLSMWDPAAGRFYTGTGVDGVTVNTNVIPTDCQSWTLLAFKNLPADYQRGLLYAESNNRVPGTWGFDFNSDCDGIWYEGTAQMAAAYELVGDTGKAQSALNQVLLGRAPSGAVYATSTESITTGFLNLDESPWYYFRREHVGATAWEALATRRINPFWQGSSLGGGVIP